MTLVHHKQQVYNSIDNEIDVVLRKFM